MKLNDFDFSKTASMAGKVFLVTGGTSGIGKQTVLALARHPSPPSSIWFTGRSSSRAESVIAQCPPGVNVNFLEMDLASFDSIKYGVRQLLLKETVLDVLILNAGVMDVPNARTKDGYEIQFGTNYLAGGYLTQLLLPKLLHSPAPRVANVVSDACLLGQKIGIDFDSLKSDGKEVGYRVLNGFVLYARSKFGQLLWGQQLAKRYPQVTVINLHPGVVKTEMFAGLPFFTWLLLTALSWWQMIPAEKGAFNQLWASTVPQEEVKSGGYYNSFATLNNAPLGASDNKIGEELWEWTTEELQPFL